MSPPTYHVIIRGELVEDDGWSLHIPGAEWPDLQRGTCPHCGGVWGGLKVDTCPVRENVLDAVHSSLQFLGELHSSNGNGLCEGVPCIP
jgi:hypothetical protein